VSICRVLLPSLLAMAAWGCSDDGNREVKPGEVAPPAALENPDDLLPRPFSAEAIREEMVVGFNLTMHRVTAEESQAERWNVISTDENTVDIEFTPLGADGNPAGPAAVRSSTWVELRDHASFPVSNSTREQVTRETRLGTLDGWLYTINDGDEGTVTELFFANELPGAPIEMRTTQGGKILMSMYQSDRNPSN
jgi:hypothetical protein